MMPMFCKTDREAAEQMMKMMEGFSKNLNLKDMMKYGFDDTDADNVEFRNEKIDGDNATVEMFNKKDNSTETIKMVKEGGVWKMCPGIAEEMKNGLGDMKKMMENGGLGALSDTLKNIMNNPEYQKGMEKVKEMMDDPKMKEMMEKMKEN
jgi:ERCC4-related helicase